MAVEETDIVVVGMGPGGEDAAGKIAGAGLHVTGVEAGGHCHQADSVDDRGGSMPCDGNGLASMRSSRPVPVPGPEKGILSVSTNLTQARSGAAVGAVGQARKAGRS
jgi:choline dehydrogenase-like flavoprotein